MLYDVLYRTCPGCRSRPAAFVVEANMGSQNTMGHLPAAGSWLGQAGQRWRQAIRHGQRCRRVAINRNQRLEPCVCQQPAQFGTNELGRNDAQGEAPPAERLVQRLVHAASLCT